MVQTGQIMAKWILVRLSLVCMQTFVNSRWHAIVEGVNENTRNLGSLHTSRNCTIAGSGETGTLVTNDCDTYGTNNVGCGVRLSSNTSYGKGFNDAGGGVYAMEWTSNWIRMWYWDHTRVPSSITYGAPDPSTFGVPSANFQGSCDIDSHFAMHHPVFDITFCGTYAGDTYGATSCPMASGKDGPNSCIDHVANSPFAFEEAYFEVNYLKIYQIPKSASSVTHHTSTLSTKALLSVKPVASTSSISLHNVGMGASTTISLSSRKVIIPSQSGISKKSSNMSTYIGHNTMTYSSKTLNIPVLSAASRVAGEPPLQTTTGSPQCHTIYLDEYDNNDTYYRIYCNATSNQDNIYTTTVESFFDCIRLCDQQSVCTGAEFTNSSSQNCALKYYYPSGVVKRTAPSLTYLPGASLAYRLASGDSPGPDDPTSSSLTDTATCT